MANPDREIWACMLTHLRNDHASLCRQWFGELEPIGITDGSMLVRVQNDVHRDYLRRECVEAFNDAARSATSSLMAIRFLGPEDPAPQEQSETGNEIRSETAGRDVGRAEQQGSDTDVSAPEPTDEPSDRGADSSPAHFGRDGESFGGIEPKPWEQRGRKPDAPAMFGRDRLGPRPSHVGSEAALASRPGTLAINPDYGFDNFVVGPTNRLAHAAAVGVASDPGRAYNPYFVHGGVGLGKTHLLQAICVKLREERPGIVIHYVSCDGFISDFMLSVQNGEMSGFRHRFRDVDVLVIDDIHFLANRDRTQEEFFHTFNSLYQSNRQIVLSSDAPPEEIPDLEDRLVSRFHWGLVAKIDPPSYETRVAILQAKARLRGMALPDEVACYIAEKISSNIRELEGAVVKIQILASMDRAPIDLSMARSALGESAAPQAAPHLTLDQIINAVCGLYQVRRSELLGKRRHQSISLPRQVCMFLARKHTRHSLEEIGGHFGGRDHTTVLHAVRSIKARRENEPDVSGAIERLEEQLSSPGA